MHLARSGAELRYSPQAYRLKRVTGSGQSDRFGRHGSRGFSGRVRLLLHPSTAQLTPASIVWVWTSGSRFFLAAGGVGEYRGHFPGASIAGGVPAIETQAPIGIAGINWFPAIGASSHIVRIIYPPVTGTGIGE